MLSVILCVNRTNPFLREAIQSVLNQTHRDFEFLIAANGSTDDLITELEEITGEDPRVKIWRLSLPQHAFSLNYLIEQAHGDWIIRMDSDDLSEPHRFEELKKYMTDPGPDIIGSWATLINEHNEKIGEAKPNTSDRQIRRGFLFRNQILHPAVAFRKSFWIEMRGYIGGFSSEDFDMWLRALRHGKSFLNIPEALLKYRVHSGQLSRSRISYAEAASYWHRELILQPSLYFLAGWLVATSKAFLMPIWRRVTEIRNRK